MRLEEVVSGAALDVVLQSQFIHAGAGAGKTTKLIKTFLEFVKAFKQKNGRYPRVVITTFTRKATQEVKERLLVSALTADEKEIFEYINKKSFVHISTIHGLLSAYLSQYAERMKFPQEIKIIDGLQYERVLKKQINGLLKKNPFYLELMEPYTFIQLTKLASQALDFKAQNKDFNFVQSDELRQIAKQKKQEIVIAIDKIFSLAARAPDNWSEYFSFLKSISDLLKQEKEAEFFELLENAPSKPRWSNVKPPFEPMAHDLIEDLKDIKLEKLFDAEDYILKHQSLNELFFKFINELYEIMNLYKRNTGELTISDLENLSLQLLEEHPDTALDFSDSWDYFMIDEYQDTSPLQVRILNQIIQNKPCFIVGDPQQSIYLFRGARSEVFQQKLNEMKNSKAEILFLEINYRSEPSLMNFINQFFSHFSGQFKPMQPKEKSSDGKIIKQDAFYIKSKDQSDAVLSHIQFLLRQGVSAQDICVLSRSNSKLIDIAVKANKASVPVQLQAASGFEEKREILDLIAFNKFLNNPHDDENLVTLIRSPWFYIGDEEILDFAQSQMAKNHSIWAAISSSQHPQKDNLIKYLNLFDLTGSLQTTKQFIIDSSFVSFSEYYDKTGKREANIFKFLISLAQAEKSLGFSLGLFLEEQFQSLQGDLGSANSEAQPVEQPNCVSLMTVHASKGLQFKHVIVIGFSDAPALSKASQITFDEDTQKFSLSVLDDSTSKHKASGWSEFIKTQFNERELLENERVLYVAMTRAVESLSLVVNIDKRNPSEKSWYKRSNWPLELGDIDVPEYRATSLSYEEIPEFQVLASQRPLKARSKFRVEKQDDNVTNSVTDLITEKSKFSEDFNSEAALMNLKKAQKGSDLHRVFESLKYLEPDQIIKNLNEQDQKNIEYLLEQKELNLKEILRCGHNEWGFGLKTKSRFIQGQIDLWAELDNEIHVLDYKTGSSAYSDKAFEQLALYTMALFEMKMISGNKKIIHSVVYPVEKIIKKKDFENFADFLNLVSPKIREIF